MNIQVYEGKGYKKILLKGSLDMYTALELKNQVDGLSFVQSETMILDLNEITYVDSSGIGTLIKIVNQLKENKVAFYLTGLKPMIEKIFKVAGLMNYFSILSEDDYKKNYPHA